MYFLGNFQWPINRPKTSAAKAEGRLLKSFEIGQLMFGFGHSLLEIANKILTCDPGYKLIHPPKCSKLYFHLNWHSKPLDFEFLWFLYILKNNRSILFQAR